MPNVLDKDPNEMTSQERLEALNKLYEDYNNEIENLYSEFLRKMTEIRKQDDLKKLQEASGVINSSS